MQSNVCVIEQGTRDLEVILKESERVAEYCGLTNKQALQLRLLCEEVDGMLPNIIENFKGSLWIECEDGLCKVKVSIRVRGREMGHPDIALDLMSRFADFCADYCTVEKPAKMEGRNMLMFLAPKSGK